MEDPERNELLKDPDFPNFFDSKDELIKAVKKLLEVRKQTLETLDDLKKDIEESYVKSRKAKIAGTVATVTGSTLAIIGFGLSFVSFGATLGLAIPAAAAAAAGGVTIAGSEIGYQVVSKIKQKIAQEACDKDKEEPKK